MQSRITNQKPPFAKLLGLPASRSFVIKLSASELATLHAAHAILEAANDAGKSQFGHDEFYDIDDNWTRAENGLTELLHKHLDASEGEWHYEIY